MGMKASNKIATFFKYFVLILVGVIMIYPLLWMIKTSREISVVEPRGPPLVMMYGPLNSWKAWQI